MMRDSRGFTLIELLMALVIGVMVMFSATTFAITTVRSVEANNHREGVHRNARFVGMSMERDFQGTGVGLSSTVSHGALFVRSDTVTILSASFYPEESKPLDLDPPAGTDNPLPPGGTCGPRCLDLKSNDYDLEVGDLARMQANDQRRLILIESSTKKGADEWAVGFTDATEIAGQLAGFSGGFLLDRFGTFVQKLAPVIYYLDGDRLMRATRYAPDGTPAGEVMAENVNSFEISVVFTDGDEAEYLDVTDTDPTNDFDDVVTVRIKAEFVASAPPTPTAKPYKRMYEWQFSPRNLSYERNR